MASKIKGFSAPSAVNGFGDALLQMANRRDASRERSADRAYARERDNRKDMLAERRMIRQDKRESKRDALAAARIEREETRYQDAKNERIAALEAPLEFIDTSTTETETYQDPKAFTMEANIDKIKEKQASIPLIDARNQKEIDMLQTKKEIETLDPKYKDLAYIKMFEARNPEEYKKWKENSSIFSGGPESMAGLDIGRREIINNIKSLWTDPEVQAQKDIALKSEIENFKKNTLGIDGFKSKLVNIENKQKAEQEKYDKQFKVQEDFINKIEKKKVFDTTKKLSKVSLVEKQKYYDDFQREGAKRIKEIKAGSENRETKARRIRAVNVAMLDKKKEYAIDQKVILDQEKTLRKENRKFNRSKALVEHKVITKAIADEKAKVNQTEEEKKISVLKVKNWTLKNKRLNQQIKDHK